MCLLSLSTTEDRKLADERRRDRVVRKQGTLIAAIAGLAAACLTFAGPAVAAGGHGGGSVAHTVGVQSRPGLSDSQPGVLGGGMSRNLTRQIQRDLNRWLQRQEQSEVEAAMAGGRA
jgi:hypothetical protein